MTTTGTPKFEIPRLTDLDASASNYVSSLDGAFLDFNNIETTLHAEGNRIFDKHVDALRGYLTDIPGAELVIQSKGIVLVKLVGTSADMTRYRREIDDLSTRATRDYAFNMRGVEDGLIEVRRAKEDFVGAINNLTEIANLNEPSLLNTKIHIYLAKGPTDSGVYQANIDFANKPSQDLSATPSLLPGMSQSVFDKDNIDQFKKGVGEVPNTNVYLVRNPSTVLPLEALFIKALLTIGEKPESSFAARVVGIDPLESLEALLSSILDQQKAKNNFFLN